MALYVLNWPGLPEIPFYVLDPKCNKLYSSEKPIPPDRLDLDVFENRYVKLSKILELFESSMRSEVNFILENLQKSIHVKPILRITEKTRKIVSYLPVEVLLTLIVIWPMCPSLMTTRKTLVNFLDHFLDSVCTDCGYIQRDCRCDRIKTSPNSKSAYVGFGTFTVEKGIQTDPALNPLMTGMNSAAAVGSGAMTQVNSQGLSLVLPSGVKLPAGIKIPVTPSGSQVAPLYYPSSSTPLAVNMIDMNSNPFGFMKSATGSNLAQQSPPVILPQPPRSHKRGRPPVAPMPYLYQPNVSYQQNVAFFGPFASDGSIGNIPTVSSLMQLPALQGMLSADMQIQGCLPSSAACGVNYVRPQLAPTGVTNSALPHGDSSFGPSSSNVGEHFQPIASRKRKFSDVEADSVGNNGLKKTVGVQTLTKSFVKKCKLKEEKLAEKGEGANRGSTTVAIVNETKENGDLVEFENTTENGHAALKLSNADNLNTSPGRISYGEFGRGGTVEREYGSKKLGVKLWRQLEDSSDEDKTVSTASNEELKNSGVEAKLKEHRRNQTEESKIGGNDGAVINTGNLANTDVTVVSRPPDVREHDARDKESLPKRDERVHIAEEAKDNDKAGDVSMEVDDGKMQLDHSPLPGTSGLQRRAFAEKKMVADFSTDVDSDKEGNHLVIDCSLDPGLSCKAGPVSVPRLSSECESEVFKVVPDEIGDDYKSAMASKHHGHEGSTVPKDALDSSVGDLKSGNVSANSDVSSTQPLPTPVKIYGKFEYVPTKEHVFKCLIPKCSQAFDTRLAAELHNLVHPLGDNASHLKCPKCDFKSPFYHWFDLARHMLESHQIYISREPFSCEMCGLNCETEENLASHIDFHYSNRYKCIHCGLVLLTWGQVKRHLETCVDKHKGNLNLGCPYCTFVFHKKNIRNIHLLSHSDIGLSCALCQDNLSWADWKTLRKHYQNRHAKVLQGKITPFRHKLPTKRKPPRCKRCDVEFKTTELYVGHMTRTHDLVPYTLVECAQCGHRFKTERSHEWHVKHVHVEEIPCEKCDFVASSKAAMKAHVSQMHSDKQHTCSECDKSFALYHQLKVHMAHHARRTIYPCQKCDQEFSRQLDLRQHMINDHADPSDKAPQSCPECDYRCSSRESLNAHIKKLHPELLEDDSLVAGADEEDEGADHCYFTKKSDSLMMAPPAEPPKLRRVGRRRGRQKKVVKQEWDETKQWVGGYQSVEDRRERRRLNRIVKEQTDRLKKLKKSTCARTRSYFEHQYMKQGGKLLNTAGRDNRFNQSRAGGADDTADDAMVTDSVGMGIYSVQPYLDHSYFKIDGSALWGTEAVNKPRPTPPALSARGDGSVVDTPDVSAFQECETQLLGLGRGMPPPRRRGRPPNSTLNRPVLDARQKFTSVLESMSASVMQSTNYRTVRLTPRPAPSTVTTETMPTEDDGFENLSAAMPDFEISDSDILQNLGAYDIIDEILNLTQESSGGTFQSPDNSAKKVDSGDMAPNSSGAGEQQVILGKTFSDTVGVDNETQLSADFNDIDLSDDVYSLFLGSNSAAPTASGSQIGNGDEAGRGVACSLTGSQNDSLSLMSLPYLTNTQSFRGLVSPRRTGNMPRNMTSDARASSSIASASSVSASLGGLSSVMGPQASSNCVTTDIAVQSTSLPSAMPSQFPRGFPAGGVELPVTRDLRFSTSDSKIGSLGYAAADDAEHCKESYLDTSALLKLSEVATNLCQSDTAASDISGSRNSAIDSLLSERISADAARTDALVVSDSSDELAKGVNLSNSTNKLTARSVLRVAELASGRKESQSAPAQQWNNSVGVTAETSCDGLDVGTSQENHSQRIDNDLDGVYPSQDTEAHTSPASDCDRVAVEDRDLTAVDHCLVEGTALENSQIVS